MERCETCAHWKTREEYETGKSIGAGRCLNVPMFWDATTWSGDGESRVLEKGFENTKAFAQDGSDYSAYLLTLPDFGCVSHEPEAKKGAQQK